MASRSISLTPSESLVRRCLLECREDMKDSVDGMKTLELRFAGGWVRDKLLGRASHDIDVALSTMTGEQFGDALTKFMEVNGQKYQDEARAQGLPDTVKGLHTIQKNPELSKHLETATTRMFGLDMDFVNLRKEVYNDESRNPQMEFGGPEEDAMRRDATVNALFYHLDKNLVEDFTGRGLEDMQNRLLRTPLEPYQTFRDDPLRILRLIRFSSQLGYQIDSHVYEAMKDLQIHKALREKISRERVGVEVGKIMASPDPLKGLLHIYQRDLFENVFASPSSQSNPDTSRMQKVYEGLQTIMDKCSAICLILRPKEDQAKTWFLASYVPWKDSATQAVSAARDGIKASNILTKLLSDAIKNKSHVLSAVTATNTDRATRSMIGNILRNAGPAWRLQILYSILCDIADEQFETVVDQYGRLLKYIDAKGLVDAASLKPIIDGNQVMKALDITKRGSWLKSALAMVIDWQFENPNGTADDAKAMLASRRSELDLD